MEITTVVKGAWDAFATQITIFLPKLIGAIIIFVLGLLIARLVKFAVEKSLRLVRFDTAGEKTGTIEFLRKGNIFKTPCEIVGSISYWFITLLVLIATMNALGLPIVSDILNNIFLYIPSVVAAIIVLVLGILFGNLLSAVIQTAASNAGLTYAENLGKTAFVVIIFFSGAVALVQLGIGTEVVSAAFVIAFGAAALASGLAFGIGGKELAANYLKRWLEEKKATDEK
jgi:hypothetical protein